jgi:hypothetical protein
MEIAMDYQIALPPTLPVTPAHFVAAWNQDRATQDAGTAKVVQPSTAQYEPVTMGAVLVSIAAGVATSALYDLIKHLLIKEGVQQRIEIQQIPNPSGDPTLVVTIKDE